MKKKCLQRLEAILAFYFVRSLASSLSASSSSGHLLVSSLSAYGSPEHLFFIFRNDLRSWADLMDHVGDLRADSTEFIVGQYSQLTQALAHG